jgi:hypothetical protein
MNKDVNLPEIVSTTWIENLALEELNMEESGVIQFNDHLNPTYHLEKSSIEFMDTLRDRFEVYVNRFNQYRGSQNLGPQIKIFKISNTINDFMLFRNSLKLVVARKATDLISIGLLSNSGGLFAARLNNNSPAVNSAHELKAYVGPFNNITWRFDGDIVNADSLVKHYLTEFIKHSAR